MILRLSFMQNNSKEYDAVPPAQIVPLKTNIPSSLLSPGRAASGIDRASSVRRMSEKQATHCAHGHMPICLIPSASVTLCKNGKASDSGMLKRRHLCGIGGTAAAAVSSFGAAGKRGSAGGTKMKSE